MPPSSHVCRPHVLTRPPSASLTLPSSCRFKGLTQLVHIGYGSDKETRHRVPGGWYKFTVHNVKELEVLLMQNKK